MTDPQVCSHCGRPHAAAPAAAGASAGPGSPAASLRVILWSLVVLLVPAAFTLATVAEPRPFPPLDPQPTPYGYTWSLLLFAVPLTALLYWYHRRVSSVQERKALWTSVILLFALGVLLDTVFGSMFFTFENVGATLGIKVPVRGGTVPVEEFGFYSFGFGAILMTYVWAREYWLAAYTPAVTPRTVRMAWRDLLGFHGGALLGTLGLIALGVLWKKFGPHGNSEGWPGYYIFLVITGLLPTILFHRTVQNLVNWEAMNFTVMLLLPVSLLWEGVLGMPYQWWGYRPEQMLGISINALSGLPIEEPLLWLAVGYAGINVYEVVRLWFRVERPTEAGAAER